MSLFSLRYDGEEHGPYEEAEVASALDAYRNMHPDDPDFRVVRLWEMQPGGSAAGERSVWDFLDERGQGG